MFNESTFLFQAQVPIYSSFSVGFGTNMTNSDIIVWQAYPDFPIVSDTYTKGRRKPANDTFSNDYDTIFHINSSHVEFISLRNLTTHDP
jgi:hypothetical protein